MSDVKTEDVFHGKKCAHLIMNVLMDIAIEEYVRVENFVQMIWNVQEINVVKTESVFHGEIIAQMITNVQEINVVKTEDVFHVEKFAHLISSVYVFQMDAADGEDVIIILLHQCVDRIMNVLMAGAMEEYVRIYSPPFQLQHCVTPILIDLVH